MERSQAAGLAMEPRQNRTDELSDFDALVRRYRPRIFRFLLASVRSPETAENLAQECFVKAFQGRHGFQGTASVGTWLFQIAANLVRDHEASGRLKFWRRALQAADLTELGNAIPDRQQSPEARAVIQQQVEAVWAAAARLPLRQRTVFLLRFVENMELLEIAAVTRMKVGTVKTHLFRALQAVRARLEGMQ